MVFRGALCLIEVDFRDSPSSSWSVEFLCFGCCPVLCGGTQEEAGGGLPQPSLLSAYSLEGSQAGVVTLAVRGSTGFFNFIFFFFFCLGCSVQPVRKEQKTQSLLRLAEFLHAAPWWAKARSLSLSSTAGLVSSCLCPGR